MCATRMVTSSAPCTVPSKLLAAGRAVSQVNVDEGDVCLQAIHHLARLCRGGGPSDDRVACILNERLKFHRKQGFVLDDQHLQRIILGHNEAIP